MEKNKFLIAGGNSSLLVWNCPISEKQKVIKQYLGEVEQIGFCSNNSDGISILTMINELCINATIALASQLNRNGILYSSGCEKGIQY